MTWRSKIRLEHYTRLNADLFTDTGAGRGVRRARGDLRRRLLGPAGAGLGLARRRGRPHRDGPRHLQPRDRVPHARGARDEARQLARKAGSVIPPGQSGFVSQSGQEDPHFEDQLDDYINWTYKPMPLSMEELEGQTESTETIPVPDSY